MALAACSSSPAATPGPTAAPASPAASVAPRAGAAAAPGSASAGQANVVQQSSRGDTTTQLESTSDGHSPVSVDGDLSGRDCSGGISVQLTLALSRDGAALPGGATIPMTRCGPFHRELQASAGRLHVTVTTSISGNLTLDLTVSSAGQSSHISIGNDSQVSASSGVGR